ncbi:MAG: hypothetical protein WB523_04935 [Candidatus Sulfotelmatobacter sp.]
MDRKTRRAQIFIGMMLLAAITSALYAGIGSHTLHPYYALALLAVAAATSRLKVKLPGIEGNMSVNLPFLLMAVVSLSAVEAVSIACLSTVVQCWPHRGGKFKPEQLLFNLSMMSFASSVANLIFHAGWIARTSWASQPGLLASATLALFLGQTVPVAGIITLTEGQPMRCVWVGIVHLSFPYYVVSVGITSMLNLVGRSFGWQAALVVFPVMYGIHLSYRLYFGREAQARPTPPLTRAAGAGA